MACLTIRNLDDDLKTRLRLQAAQHGCSMEAEVRNILSRALKPPAAENNFALQLRRRFEGLYPEQLPIPPRQETRTPPEIGE